MEAPEGIKMENEYTLAGYSQPDIQLGVHSQHLVEGHRKSTPVIGRHATRIARFHLPGLADGMGPLQVLGCDCWLDTARLAPPPWLPPILLWMMQVSFDERVDRYGTANQPN